MKRSPHDPHVSNSPRSFTLLELLAVVTLLGLLAGYTMRGLLLQPVSATQTLRRLAAIDAEARLLARQRGPLSMKFESGEDGSSTVITLSREDLERSYELNALIGFDSKEPLTDTLGFDRHGQSVDYTATISYESRVLHVAGLTGWSQLGSQAEWP